MIYYYKGSQILTPFTIVSNQPVFDSDTISLRKQRASQSAQRWEMSFSTVESNNAVEQFLGSVLNVDVKETMTMPQFPEIAKATTVDGNPTVFSAYTQGVSEITVTSTGITGILPRGAFVSFDNHDKVYVVTETVDFTTGVSETVKLFPSLRAGVSGTTTMLVGDDATFTYYRSIDNLKGIRYADGILTNTGTIDLVEAL